jgi:hypothetical protein
MFLVETPEDLANMWPGYANNPCASFPEMAQGWRWKISHDEGMHGGPYASDKTKYRYERGIPLEALVYTEKPHVVDGVQRHTYEVWRRGSPEVERGIREGVLYVVPLGALLATSAKNGRCFLGDEARDVYDKRYDVRDLTGFERDVPSPPDAALAPETAPLGVATDVETYIGRTVYRLIRSRLGISQDGTESTLPPGTLIERSRVAAMWFPANSRELVTLHFPLNPRQPQPPVYRAAYWYRLRGALRCPIGRQLIDLPDHALVEPRSRLCRNIQSLGMNLLEPIAVLIPLTPEPALDSAVPQSEPAPVLEAPEPAMRSDDPVATQPQTSGRKDDYPEKEPFTLECYRSYFELLEKSRRRKRPSMPMVAKNMKPDISEGTLRKNLKRWGIPYPPTAPSDRPTVEDLTTTPQQ